MRVGIAGASGFTGLELLRLCATHPDLEVVVATGETQAGVRAADLYPSLAVVYPDLVFEPLDVDGFDGIDVAFLTLPGVMSQQLVPELAKRVSHIIDLGSGFRLRDAETYAKWFGEPHPCPELLADFACGIPELFRDDLEGAALVAAAGCYVTAAALALSPLVRAGVIETDGIIVDGVSGVSGAGRSLKYEYHHATVNEDFVAYGLVNHRHTPEMEQAVGGHVLFTPHLAPMTRGLLTTCYARATGDTDPLAVLREAYADERFVVVSDASPSTKAALGANTAHLTARYDDRTGWVVAVCALDNLVKGASGQMIQCANLALGLDEAAGLPVAGVYP